MASGSGRGEVAGAPGGELMPEVPPPSPKKGRPGPSQTQEEKTAHLDQGRKRLVGKLIELAMEAFTKASVDPERFGFGRSLVEI
ncbi:hypothetical protein R1flu_025159 [Riccia fluitans]|uniref:Uncharacterized protein n=1 Tax=Riccia fluitans TaxID=41844 RepID=A0ABD1XX51_9MARC